MLTIPVLTKDALRISAKTLLFDILIKGISSLSYKEGTLWIVTIKLFGIARLAVLLLSRNTPKPVANHPTVLWALVLMLAAWFRQVPAYCVGVHSVRVWSLLGLVCKPVQLVLLELLPLTVVQGLLQALMVSLLVPMPLLQPIKQSLLAVVMEVRILLLAAISLSLSVVTH